MAWLQARNAQFTLFFRSRLPRLGRLPEPDFWYQVIRFIQFSKLHAMRSDLKKATNAHVRIVR